MNYNEKEIEKIAEAFSSFYSASISKCNFNNESGISIITLNDFNSIVVTGQRGKINSISSPSKDNCYLDKRFCISSIARDTYDYYDPTIGLYRSKSSLLSTWNPHYTYFGKIKAGKEDYPIFSSYSFKSKRNLENLSGKLENIFYTSNSYLSKSYNSEISNVSNIYYTLRKVTVQTKKFLTDHLFKDYTIEDIIKMLIYKQTLDAYFQKEHDELIELDGTKDLLLHHKRK